MINKENLFKESVKLFDTDGKIVNELYEMVFAKISANTKFFIEKIIKSKTKEILNNYSEILSYIFQVKLYKILSQNIKNKEHNNSFYQIVDNYEEELSLFEIKDIGELSFDDNGNYENIILNGKKYKIKSKTDKGIDLSNGIIPENEYLLIFEVNYNKEVFVIKGETLSIILDKITKSINIEYEIKKFIGNYEQKSKLLESFQSFGEQAYKKISKIFIDVERNLDGIKVNDKLQNEDISREIDINRDQVKIVLELFKEKINIDFEKNPVLTMINVEEKINQHLDIIYYEKIISYFGDEKLNFLKFDIGVVNGEKTLKGFYLDPIKSLFTHFFISYIVNGYFSNVTKEDLNFLINNYSPEEIIKLEPIFIKDFKEFMSQINEKPGFLKWTEKKFDDFGIIEKINELILNNEDNLDFLINNYSPEETEKLNELIGNNEVKDLFLVISCIGEKNKITYGKTSDVSFYDKSDRIIGNIYL